MLQPKITAVKPSPTTSSCSTLRQGSEKSLTFSPISVEIGTGNSAMLTFSVRFTSLAFQSHGQTGRTLPRMNSTMIPSRLVALPMLNDDRLIKKVTP